MTCPAAQRLRSSSTCWVFSFSSVRLAGTLCSVSVASVLCLCQRASGSGHRVRFLILTFVPSCQHGLNFVLIFLYLKQARFFGPCYCYLFLYNQPIRSAKFRGRYSMTRQTKARHGIIGPWYWASLRITTVVIIIIIDVFIVNYLNTIYFSLSLFPK